MLPFDLPRISRGFAALTPAARARGADVAAAAGAALSSVIGREVAVRARCCSGAPAARAVAARLAVDLPRVPAAALLEVEPALVVALVDALAGGSGFAGGATTLTPVETSALELLALAALDGACGVAPVEDALAPRLARGAAEPGSALAIELDVDAGGISGRARLLVPPAAVRALSGVPAEGPALAARLLASVRSGAAALAPGELDGVAAGDVVLLDPPGGTPDALVLPGGARLAGRLEAGAFHVEVIMTDRNAGLPVLLEVELARVEVSLGELARLEPGAALPLALDRRGLVTLRIGERAFARGELVDVDGAVGVRVTALEVAP